MERDPFADKALYNRARTYFTLGERAKALKDLGKAIRLNENLALAKKDSDFQDVWDDEEFKTLIE